MLALLLAQTADAATASDIEKYVGGGALASIVIYLTIHGLPSLMKRWGEVKEKIVAAERSLDESRTQNQKMILEMTAGIHKSASEIAVVYRQILERGIEATGRAETHADNLERIVTTAGQDGRRNSERTRT